MQQSEHYTKAERLGHLISWLILISVPIGVLLVIGGWLPHPFGDLGCPAARNMDPLSREPISC